MMNYTCSLLNLKYPNKVFQKKDYIRTKNEEDTCSYMDKTGQDMMQMLC